MYWTKGGISCRKYGCANLGPAVLGAILAWEEDVGLLYDSRGFIVGIFNDGSARARASAVGGDLHVGSDSHPWQIYDGFLQPSVQLC